MKNQFNAQYTGDSILDGKKVELLTGIKDSMACDHKIFKVECLKNHNPELRLKHAIDIIELFDNICKN